MRRLRWPPSDAEVVPSRLLRWSGWVGGALIGVLLIGATASFFGTSWREELSDPGVWVSAVVFVAILAIEGLIRGRSRSERSDREQEDGDGQ